MTLKARSRAGAVALVLLLIGVVLAAGQVTGTFALFTSETENANSVFAGDWVAAPTGLGTPTISGLGASLAWTHATHGVTGQEIWYADQATTTNCTGVTYSGLVTGSSLSATANSISGTGSPNDAVPSGDNGDNICYQIRSTHNAWYTVANFSVIQVGLVPISVSYNGAGKLLKTNTITITFNQPFSYSAGNINVCAIAGTPGTVQLGTCGGTPALGQLVGGTVTNGGTCAGSTVGGSGTSTLTITLSNSCPSGVNAIGVSGTATYTGSGSNVASSTGSVSQCTKSNCKPTLTY